MTYWVINYTVIKKLVSDRKTATISKLRKKGLKAKQISLHLTLNFISREQAPSPGTTNQEMERNY